MIDPASVDTNEPNTGRMSVRSGINASARGPTISAADPRAIPRTGSRSSVQGAKVAIASDINTYGVLNAGVMVVTENALGKIEAVLNK